MWDREWKTSQKICIWSFNSCKNGQSNTQKLCSEKDTVIQYSVFYTDKGCPRIDFDLHLLRLVLTIDSSVPVQMEHMENREYTIWKIEYKEQYRNFHNTWEFFSFLKREIFYNYIKKPWSIILY